MSNIKSTSDKNLLFATACNNVIERLNQAAREMGHKQVFFCDDKEANLIAIIAIHDKGLGPGPIIGATRL